MADRFFTGAPGGMRWGRASGRFPVTDDLSARLLRLPIYYGITDAEVDAVIDAVNAAVNNALAQPDLKKSLEAQGMLGTGGPPQRYAERVRREFDKWSKLVREAGIKAE